MEAFQYEIVAAPDGAAVGAALRAMIEVDPILRGRSEPWDHAHLPAQADLYAQLFVVTPGLIADRGLRRRIAQVDAGGFPQLPVVDDLDQHDFRAGIHEVSRHNARGLNRPDDLLRTLRHHAGLELYDGTGSVFISYGRVDGAPVAQAIRDELTLAGIGKTLDVDAFPGGEVFQDRIERHLRRSDLLILVDTPASSQSGWVERELEIAHVAGIPVVAVAPTGVRYAYPVPHVEWQPGSSPAQAAVAEARRLLARTIVFRDRVSRTLSRLGRLRTWDVRTEPTYWTVHPSPSVSVRVVAQTERPRAEDVQRLVDATPQGSGLLVAGFRSYLPQTVRALRRVGEPAVSITPLPTLAPSITRLVASPPPKRVFLSAAEPDEPDDVALAGRTLARFVVTLSQALVELGSTLVFGGHPKVTPLVHRAIEALAGGGTGGVELHQAKTWKKDNFDLPPDVREGALFRGAIWHGDASSIPADLDALRSGMIGTDLDAAVFIGGKTLKFLGPRPGIIDEHERFTRQHPGKPVFVLGMAGGAARQLPEALLDDLLRDTADPELAVALIVAELFKL